MYSQPRLFSTVPEGSAALTVTVLARGADQTCGRARVTSDPVLALDRPDPILRDAWSRLPAVRATDLQRLCKTGMCAAISNHLAVHLDEIWAVTRSRIAAVRRRGMRRWPGPSQPDPGTEGRRDWLAEVVLEVLVALLRGVGRPVGPRPDRPLPRRRPMADGGVGERSRRDPELQRPGPAARLMRQPDRRGPARPQVLHHPRRRALVLGPWRDHDPVGAAAGPR